MCVHVCVFSLSHVPSLTPSLTLSPTHTVNVPIPWAEYSSAQYNYSHHPTNPGKSAQNVFSMMSPLFGFKESDN